MGDRRNSQRYVDRMSQLLSSGSPEPNNIWSPPTSIAGSVDDDCHSQQTDESDDDSKAAFMDRCSDEEGTQGHQAKEQTKERVLGGARSVKFLNPEYSAESIVKMIECVAELDGRVQSDAKSLKGQDRWNQGMQRKYIDMIGSINTLTKEVATLRKQVDVLSSRDAVKTREAVGSKRQKQ
ncbi:hypothetical protein DTO013E5_10062 [Penicillium roqueforti]|uniref:Uncharacterized protein n=1 Tax=Penicillium roqueforti (strain FM164) TaxID=1365484 RepID=W6R3Y8_PENRF|nr:hypothetical protein DTO012A1_10186 [Penicillium roqueforti]CDM36512.1 hypothetical protein PROQFM164_S05g000345 [Penicillium roqueforti FM164]KAI2734510.1 hypothetical protein DTO013F2_10289 [Penicillium roqueforti]KAI2765696.1 hypothetical protein DTO012A8_9088 [Penicillium roqueforti]KAI3061731.1 hypothetical protein CBS147339_9985 [Penicillium roqueforti]